ncbi:protein of unknown function [Paraburkholderia dioscoreae]|uniref:Uncharacterized protein n=1 Tax=Paraburkholderia dioscoreae TaxID=2604047 RepID=A0A5Q4Z3U9_9BURK|nr:protein of unknown function [Paraburkholderia dioscoreae]
MVGKSRQASTREYDCSILSGPVPSREQGFFRLVARHDLQLAGSSRYAGVASRFAVLSVNIRHPAGRVV